MEHHIWTTADLEHRDRAAWLTATESDAQFGPLISPNDADESSTAVRGTDKLLGGFRRLVEHGLNRVAGLARRTKSFPGLLEVMLTLTLTLIFVARWTLKCSHRSTTEVIRE
ncbi:hypothetical protein HK405_011589 [Cladochytrium tenue]|nr:hypothetical protein HK405_011589 [Cladochytrium tenue]